MSFNNGTSVIKDTKVVGADKIAFDVCTWSSYKATSLDVTGNSEIKGDIEISSTNTPDALSLMLTSGTHDGAIIMAQGADKATVSKVNEFVQAAPADYKWKDNGDGTSTLVPCTYVAKIGEGESAKKYESLQEAVAAVKDGETILMLADVPNAGGMSVSSGKNFTVDFNGHTYTLNKPGAGSTGTETNGFQLLKNSTIEFKNGTINISEDNITKAVDPATYHPELREPDSRWHDHRRYEPVWRTGPDPQLQQRNERAQGHEGYRCRQDRLRRLHMERLRCNRP